MIEKGIYPTYFCSDRFNHVQVYLEGNVILIMLKYRVNVVIFDIQVIYFRHSDCLLHDSHKIVLVNSTNFLLIFRKCRISTENTIRPSCNCLNDNILYYIVTHYCPVAYYHYVHNLWQSVWGNSEHIFVVGYFLKMEAFRSELLTGH